MTGSILLSCSAAIAVAAIALTSCESETRYGPQNEAASEGPQRRPREAGDELTKELMSTHLTMPTDANLRAEFRAYRHDYVAVADYVRANPDLTRFDLSISPPRYYTFAGKEGRISELDEVLTQILFRGTLPKIIDGDLRLDAHYPELQFLNHRSGTVVAGESKGISFAPSGLRGPVVDTLDNLSVVRDAVRNVESKCAYRRIEDHWYVFVCG